MKKIYICCVKSFGSSFAVETEEEAQRWVWEDPTWNYFEVLEIKNL